MTAWGVLSFIKPIYKVWEGLASLIGEVITRIILGMIFFLVVTPIGFILRLWGKDFLNLKEHKKVSTCWIPKEKRFTKLDYERQF